MTLRSLTTGATVPWSGALALAPVVLIYKHSPACGFSMSALPEVRDFAAANGTVPVLMVDVIRQAPLARRIGVELEVQHESPQVILLHEGRVVWTTSHFGITRDTLERETARLAALD